MVGIDCLVAFEGRQYSVPFAHIGERWKSVAARARCRSSRIVVCSVHQRYTPARLVIDPAHYDGTSTPRVVAPPPLGRMGAKTMELATAPVAHARSNTMRHWRRSPGDGGSATGTPSVYRPPGHDYRGGHRAAGDGDYEPWTPSG